jgi:hypothetical protein
MTGCGIIGYVKKANRFGRIVMKIMWADDCSQFREKVCNKQIAGAVHAIGLAALVGASHG